jgi:hypothetical protein
MNTGVDAAVRHARGHVWSLLALAVVLGPACAKGSDAITNGENFTPVGSGGSGHDASASADDASSSGSGSGSSSGSGLNSDDGSGTTTTPSGDDATVTQSDADNIITDDASSGDDSGSVTTPGEASAPPGYACVTTLSPAPVCDSSHNYCLCTADAQCNSHGLNNGGCHSGKCPSGQQCRGGGFSDSAGCSVVNPTCNIGMCPSGTKCEGGPSSGWASNSKKSLCGTALQCCWCTSDSACPVSGKCINDSTQNNCMGAGPCTGSGTNFDGMHCELASPGIPMCTMN